jgi:hypothetical protein
MVFYNRNSKTESNLEGPFKLEVLELNLVLSSNLKINVKSRKSHKYVGTNSF